MSTRSGGGFVGPMAAQLEQEAVAFVMGGGSFFFKWLIYSHVSDNKSL